jgi:trans-aconitate 2-methyltransferase
MWDPEQYLRYAEERSRPFFDLVRAVPLDRPKSVVDLGCGPGGLTATLVDRWPDARIRGLDSSAEMVSRARRRAVPPRLVFDRGDVTDWIADEPVDLVLSNACLHWVEDHDSILERLVPQVAGAGVIAFQVPDNSSEPSHRLLAEVVSGPAWRARVDTLRRPSVRPTEWYVAKLTDLGFRVDAWETRYMHVLDGAHPVLEWMKGTTLRPILDVLVGGERDRFLHEYSELLDEAYPQRSGRTVFPFRRVFVVAQRTG